MVFLVLSFLFFLCTNNGLDYLILDPCAGLHSLLLEHILEVSYTLYPYTTPSTLSRGVGWELSEKLLPSCRFGVCIGILAGGGVLGGAGAWPATAGQTTCGGLGRRRSEGPTVMAGRRGDSSRIVGRE